MSPAEGVSSGVGAEIFSWRARKSFWARSWREASSAATRFWMWSSRVFARVLSVCEGWVLVWFLGGGWGMGVV